MRTVAGHLLSQFPEQSRRRRPGYAVACRWERDPDVQASLLLCLGVLRDLDAVTGKALEKAIRFRRDDPRRLSCCLPA